MTCIKYISAWGKQLLHLVLLGSKRWWGTWNVPCCTSWSATCCLSSSPVIGRAALASSCTPACSVEGLYSRSSWCSADHSNRYLKKTKTKYKDVMWQLLLELSNTYFTNKNVLNWALGKLQQAFLFYRPDLYSMNWENEDLVLICWLFYGQIIIQKLFWLYIMYIFEFLLRHNKQLVCVFLD